MLVGVAEVMGRIVVDQGGAALPRLPVHVNSNNDHFLYFALSKQFVREDVDYRSKITSYTGTKTSRKAKRCTNTQNTIMVWSKVRSQFHEAMSTFVMIEVQQSQYYLARILP